MIRCYHSSLDDLVHCNWVEQRRWNHHCDIVYIGVTCICMYCVLTVVICAQKKLILLSFYLGKNKWLNPEKHIHVREWIWLIIFKSSKIKKIIYNFWSKYWALVKKSRKVYEIHQTFKMLDFFCIYCQQVKCTYEITATHNYRNTTTESHRPRRLAPEFWDCCLIFSFT